MIERLLERTRLKGRIAIGFAIGVLLTLLIIFIAYRNVSLTQEAFEQFVTLNQKSAQELKLGKWVHIMQKLVRDYIHTQKDDIPPEVERLYRQMTTLLENRRSDSTHPEEIDRITLHLDKYYQAFLEAVPDVKEQRRLYHTIIPEKSSEIQDLMRNMPVALSESFGRSELNFYYFLNTLDTPYLVAARKHQAELDYAIARLQKKSTDTKLRHLREVLTAHHADLSRLLQLNRNMLFLTNVVMAAEASEVLYLSKELGHRIDAQRQQAETKIVDTSSHLTTNLLVVGTLIILLGWLLIIRVSRSITEPIDALTDAFNRITSGEGDVTVPDYHNNDELGKLSRAAVAFNQLNAQLRLRDRELQNINEKLEAMVSEAVTRVKKQDEIIFRQMRERSVSDLLVNIAHQWRQPLNVIAIEAQNINDVVEFDQADPEAISAIVDTIVAKTVSLSDIITQFTKLHQHPNSDKESFSLGTVADQSIELLSMLVSRSGVRFERHGIETVTLYHYRQYFFDTYVSLIKNALEAFIEHGTKKPLIQLGFRQDAEWIDLIIEDNAGGIDPEIRELIFDPYQTTGFKSSQKGMGLYYVKRIVEANLGGVILVDHLHEATRFTIRIPNDQ